MKKVLLSLCSLFLATIAHSQSRADNWYFGNQAGITFSTNPPSFLPGSQMSTNEGCASLSDTSGNLLFYSSGSIIWSRDHNIMPNGMGLNGSTTCTQSALFIPDPGNDSLYYLFTPPDFLASAFCYSIVDMTLNNGYGDITNKNTVLFSPSTEKVTATLHSNGTDIWVIGHSYNNADFYSYLITPAGINTTPVISTAGIINSGVIQNKIGIMKASPCGDKIALVVFDSAFVELFDFDNSSGIVSNAIHLGNYEYSSNYGVYGTEFSPDGSKLYVIQEHPALLVQYDLLAGSTAAIIASADSIVYLPFEFFAGLQNGPDGKIYIVRYNSGPFLSCINNPDNLGAACNFIDTAVIISPGSGVHGLPNFLTSDFCNHNTGVSNLVISNNTVSIYPNPTTDFITIHYNSTSQKGTTVSLFNLYGQLLKTILNEKQLAGEQEIKIDMRSFPAGIYFVKVSDGEKEEMKKVVKY
jgi:hypothetical protein